MMNRLSTLKKRLFEKGITQQQMAFDLGISEAMLSRIIRGYNEPTKEQIQEICAYLKESPEILGFPTVE
jgi:transcriptional regulator with XRE-family HTH domain